MKHAQLRAIGQNVADSLASGIGLMIGVYEMDVFGEAARSRERAITVDFLRGAIIEGQATQALADAVRLYPEALGKLCTKAGGSPASFRELTARYWSDHLHRRRFAVTVEDTNGRRSTTEYGGIPGQRVKYMDALGRLRPKPSVR